MSEPTVAITEDSEPLSCGVHDHTDLSGPSLMVEFGTDTVWPKHGLVSDASLHHVSWWQA